MASPSRPFPAFVLPFAQIGPNPSSWFPLMRGNTQVALEKQNEGAHHSSSLHGVEKPGISTDTRYDSWPVVRFDPRLNYHKKMPVCPFAFRPMGLRLVGKNWVDTMNIHPPFIHPSIHPIILHWQLWQCWTYPSYLRQVASTSLSHREKKTTIHTYSQFRAANICTAWGSQDTCKKPTQPRGAHVERLSSECQTSTVRLYLYTDICGQGEKKTGFSRLLKKGVFEKSKYTFHLISFWEEPLSVLLSDFGCIVARPDKRWWMEVATPLHIKSIVNYLPMPPFLI